MLDPQWSVLSTSLAEHSESPEVPCETSVESLRSSPTRALHALRKTVRGWFLSPEIVPGPALYESMFA